MKRSTTGYLLPKMINFVGMDFSKCHSKEVHTFPLTLSVCTQTLLLNEIGMTRI